MQQTAPPLIQIPTNKVFIASIQTVSQVETISYENDSIHQQYCLMWLQMEDNEFHLFAESSQY